MRRRAAGLLAVTLSASLLQVPGVVAPAAVAADPVPDGAVTERKAIAAAKKAGKPVEVITMRGEHRTVRALPDGRMEVTQHLRPVRTRKGGRWVDIDTKLRASGSSVVPGAVTTGLRLSDGGEGPLFELSRAGRRLSVSWPHKLPEPRLDGDTAIYRGVLGRDVDLRVRALPDGVAHTLVVKTAEAAKDPRLAKLAFKLDTARLTVREDGSGTLSAVDTAAKAELFTAPAPVMWDSAGGGTADAPGARVTPVKVDVAGKGLTLTPDTKALASPDTKFPLYIDPTWSTGKAWSWGMVSSAYPDQSFHKFAGKSSEGLGRCSSDTGPECAGNPTKRLFYRMPLPSIRGAHVQSAEFIAYETDAHECGTGRSVQLWRTGPLTESATWKNTKDAWREQLAARSVGYCDRTPVGFAGEELRRHLQDAVDQGKTDITFGLRAANEESPAWWKRFSDDAYVRIQYNRSPLKPDTATMFSSPGGDCVARADAKYVAVRPKLYATLSDPDSGDKVQTQFRLSWANEADGSDWGVKWTGPVSAAKSSGSRFGIDLAALDVPVPVGTPVRYQARGGDGTVWGPWSGTGTQNGCYFTYDPSVPAAPTVTSADYPNDSTWNDGVGDPGIFTIGDPEGVAARYELSLNGTRLPSVDTESGAARHVQVTPDRSGPNQLTVQGFSRAGQSSAVTTYEFWVNSGADAAGRFPLNEAAGGTTVTATGPGRAAHVRGATTLGADGKNGTALRLDGGYAERPLPVVDTAQDFTVSAWVKPRDAGTFTALAQNGTRQSGFLLGIEADGRPSFKMPATDGSGVAWHVARGGNAVAPDAWTHMTGVYDASGRTLKLYTNGQLQATVGGVTSWRAGGPFQIGRGLVDGAYGPSLAGSIDDVQAFRDALADQAVADLAAGTVPSGAALAAHWKLDETDGSRRVHSPVATPKATLGAGATLGHSGQEGTALKLDGTGGHAATAAPLLNTTRSFTVTAWARLGTAGGDATILSQDGTRNSGFTLGYDDASGKWVFGRPQSAADGSARYTATSQQAATPGEWTHLVGVYDATSKRLRLHVNGAAATQSAEVDSSWHAGGGFQIGRAQSAGAAVAYWPGLIDDVRIYDRVITADEAAKLAVVKPSLTARWILNDDASGYPQTAPDLTLQGGATVDPTAGFKWVSSGGLLLNGTTAFAESATAPVRTDGSFTVAGWVRNMERPTTARTVFSQAGANTDAFAVRYAPAPDDPTTGGWQLEMNSADDASSTPVTAPHPGFSPWGWDHLAVVYDARLNRMSLYVNGQLFQSGDRSSQVDGVVPFAGTNGGLQLGRTRFGGTNGSQFWPDAIDDVWVYKGALSADQVGSLAGGVELPNG